MNRSIKYDMRKKARMIKGTVNLLMSDAAYICSDTNDFDLIGLNQSIPEAKNTIQALIDHVMELEYMLYMVTQQESS